MKIIFPERKKKLAILLTILLTLTACSSSKVKVLSAWKGENDNIAKFKSKNVFVMARTADNSSRIAFEEKITQELLKVGINATESFKKVPKIYPNRVITEERLEMIKSLLKSEGYNAVVLTVIKDKEKSTSTSSTGIYIGAYGNYYPGYYGNFNDYFMYPYAYGPYYNSFGGTIPATVSSHTSITYVLETVAFNLDEAPENQLVAVINSSIKDPKKAYEIADKYVDTIIEHLK